MLMRPDCTLAGIEAAELALGAGVRPRRILLSPQGRRLDQATARRLSELDALVLVCGRYEGFDERLRYFVHEATANLSERAAVHDRSKLHPPEVEAFDIATPKLAELEYGSEEYKESLRELGPALQHHFQKNDHHPEHFENGVRGMSLMALIEMLCDWRAASERTKQRTDDPEKMQSFESGLLYNKERFGISDDLYEILVNTARELGMT